MIRASSVQGRVCALTAAALIGLSCGSLRAAPIVIDDFTYQQGFAGGQNNATGPNLLYNLASDPGSYGGFTTRSAFSQYSVDPTNQVFFSGTFSSPGGGTLTLRHAKGGTPLITGSNPYSQTRLFYTGATVDLTGGGSNNTLRVAFSGATITGLSPAAALVVTDALTTSVYIGGALPTTTVSGTTVDIPFSAFSDPSVFSAATSLAFEFENSVFAGQARSAEYTLTGISSVYVVPEPATCAVALGGLMCGGYVLRRRKRLLTDARPPFMSGA